MALFHSSVYFKECATHLLQSGPADAGASVVQFSVLEEEQSQITESGPQEYRRIPALYHTLEEVPEPDRRCVCVCGCVCVCLGWDEMSIRRYIIALLHVIRENRYAGQISIFYIIFFVFV